MIVNISSDDDIEGESAIRSPMQNRDSHTIPKLHLKFFGGPCQGEIQ